MKLRNLKAAKAYGDKLKRANEVMDSLINADLTTGIHIRFASLGDDELTTIAIKDVQLCKDVIALVSNGCREYIEALVAKIESL